VFNNNGKYIMKTGIKRALCAFFGAAVLTVGLSACNRHHDWGQPLNAQEYAERRAKVVEKIAGKLDLTEDQKRRLNVLGDKLHEQRIALMGQTTDPRAEIKALIASNTFDTLRPKARKSLPRWRTFTTA
jgi:protein CpxP